jgi:hypothetical protein
MGDPRTVASFEKPIAAFAASQISKSSQAGTYGPRGSPLSDSARLARGQVFSSDRLRCLPDCWLLLLPLTSCAALGRVVGSANCVLKSIGLEDELWQRA